MSAKSAVYVIVRDEQQRILLLRRHNTGYLNGWYDIPGGHVEYGETIFATGIRELKEETGIDAEPNSLRLWHVNQFYANGEIYYCFFFMCERWSGVPLIAEPHKSDDLRFIALNNMPPTTPATHVALQHIHDEPVSFGMVDQAVYDQIVGGAGK